MRSTGLKIATDGRPRAHFLVYGFNKILSPPHDYKKDRSKGTAISTVDCLIAALSIEQDAQLLTFDKDFAHMAKHCALRLFDNSGPDHAL